MNLDALNEKIKSGDLPRVLFFCGEEDYMLESRIKAIKKKLIPEDLSAFNYNIIDGKTTVNDIIQAAEVLPQMSDRRMLVVKNSGLFSNLKTAEYKRLKEYVLNLPYFICLIFWEKDFDPKKIGSLKFIESDAGGGVVNFEFMPVNKLEAWIERTLRGENKNISASELSYFVRSSGRSMRKLGKECGKLISYMGENRHKVTRADIDAVVDKSVEVKVYDIFNKSIIEGRGGKTMEQLGSLKAENAAPTMVLSVILDQVYELLLCKILKQDGMSVNEIMEYYDRRPPLFAVKKAVENSGKYSADRLMRMVDRGLKYSMDIKTGKLDGWDAVDLYVSELICKK